MSEKSQTDRRSLRVRKDPPDGYPGAVGVGTKVAGATYKLFRECIVHERRLKGRGQKPGFALNRFNGGMLK